MTTYAVSDSGYVDGPLATARFGVLQAMAADKDGSLYVYDFSAAKIRKISKTGIVSTYAGSTKGDADGPATTAQFSDVEGMVVAGDGTLYISDWANEQIKMITPRGVVATLAGRNVPYGYADGTGTGALFNNPAGMTLSADKKLLYVVDLYNFRIRMITLPGAVVTTIAGRQQFHGNEPPVVNFSLVGHQKKY